MWCRSEYPGGSQSEVRELFLETHNGEREEALSTTEGGAGPSGRSEFYAGEHGKGDLLFPITAWNTAQQDLATADSVMQALAANYDATFLSNLEGRVPWPARRLQLSRGFRKIEIRVMLNPNYLVEGERFYELHENRTSRLGLFGRDSDHRKVAEYSRDQVANRELLTRDIEALISRL